MKKDFSNLLLLLCSSILVLVIVELTFRWIQPPRPRKLQPRVKYVFVPPDSTRKRYCDYIYLVPNQTGYSLDASVEVSSLGIRNVEVTSQSQPNSIRILALGDSHTFGYGVSDEETWPRLLEQKL